MTKMNRLVLGHLASLVRSLEGSWLARDWDGGKTLDEVRATVENVKWLLSAPRKVGSKKAPGKKAAKK